MDTALEPTDPESINDFTCCLFTWQHAQCKIERERDRARERERERHTERETDTERDRERERERERERLITWCHLAARSRSTTASRWCTSSRLSSEYGTHKTVTPGFWPWLSDKSHFWPWLSGKSTSGHDGFPGEFRGCSRPDSMAVKSCTLKRFDVFPVHSAARSTSTTASGWSTSSRGGRPHTLSPEPYTPLAGERCYPRSATP